MKAYACVYRRPIPRRADHEQTRRHAARDPILAAFLSCYLKSYYDWGDDPSFFCAEQLIGDVRAASWGVCRPDVRAVLEPGDFVAFFCGRPRVDDRRVWDYYYIGVGTVGRLVGRSTVWQSRSLRVYRRFYNILAEWRSGRYLQSETFYPFHDDWRHRLASPYILFDPEQTDFNLKEPLHAATYSGHLPETWRSRSSAPVRELKRLLLDGHSNRGLRTSRTGTAHVKLRIRAADLAALRRELLALVWAAA